MSGKRRRRMQEYIGLLGQRTRLIRCVDDRGLLVEERSVPTALFNCCDQRGRAKGTRHVFSRYRLFGQVLGFFGSVSLDANVNWCEDHSEG